MKRPPGSARRFSFWKVNMEKNIEESDKEIRLLVIINNAGHLADQIILAAKHDDKRKILGDLVDYANLVRSQINLLKMDSSA